MAEKDLEHSHLHIAASHEHQKKNQRIRNVHHPRVRITSPGTVSRGRDESLECHAGDETAGGRLCAAAGGGTSGPRHVAGGSQNHVHCHDMWHPRKYVRTFQTVRLQTYASSLRSLRSHVLSSRRPLCSVFCPWLWCSGGPLGVVVGGVSAPEGNDAREAVVPVSVHAGARAFARGCAQAWWCIYHGTAYLRTYLALLT